MPHNTSLTVVDQLVQWADQQPLIRAVLLTSSRANPAAPVDPLSDYDVILVVSDNRPFLDVAWLCALGTPLVCLPDPVQYDTSAAFTRLVLYEDGTKIDLYDLAGGAPTKHT